MEQKPKKTGGDQLSLKFYDRMFQDVKKEKKIVIYRRTNGPSARQRRGKNQGNEG